MAVSATIVQADGNQVRGAMMLVDMDGNTSFNTGTDLGCTVVSTDESGTDVDASAAIAYASTGAITPGQLIRDTVDELNSNLTGVACSWWKNTPDEYVISFEAIAGVAWNVDLSTTVFTPGA